MASPFCFGCQEAQSRVTSLITTIVLAHIWGTIIFPLVHKVIYGLASGGSKEAVWSKRRAEKGEPEALASCSA